MGPEWETLASDDRREIFFHLLIYLFNKYFLRVHSSRPVLAGKATSLHEADDSP
jgi:hypothetical protein